MPRYFLELSSRIPSEKLQILIGEPLMWVEWFRRYSSVSLRMVEPTLIEALQYIFPIFGLTDPTLKSR